MSSRGGTRPFGIANVYLFDAAELRLDQACRTIKSGDASTVRAELWAAAEICPVSIQSLPNLAPEQTHALSVFRV